MSEPDSDVPAEASTVLRQRTVEVLGRHFAQDHIGLAEFERRVHGAYVARSEAELRALVSDLPALPESLVTAVPALAGAPDAGEKRELVTNILGSSERRGPWRPPPRLLVTTVMGGVVLDFREALFATDEVEVMIVSLAGAVEIVVPPELRVEFGGLPIMGSFEHRPKASSPSGGRLVRVKGVALLGSVEVKTLRPGEPHEPEW